MELERKSVAQETTLISIRRCGLSITFLALLDFFFLINIKLGRHFFPSLRPGEVSKRYSIPAWPLVLIGGLLSSDLCCVQIINHNLTCAQLLHRTRIPCLFFFSIFLTKALAKRKSVVPYKMIRSLSYSKQSFWIFWEIALSGSMYLRVS